MAKLLVFQGDSLERTVELTALPLTIGRGTQNGLILSDPIKSVSREHAEIRFESGAYVLVDRASQNGIWVGGKRLAEVRLDAGVVAAIGRYRLEVEPGPPPQAFLETEDKTTISRRPKLEEVLTSANTLPPPLEGPPAPAPLAEPALPTPSPVPASEPSAGSSTKRQAEGSTRRQPGPNPTRSSRWLIAAGVGVTLLIGGGLAWQLTQPKPVEQVQQPVPPVSQLIADARAKVVQGACAEALSAIIVPALANDPTNAELLQLKESAEACLKPAAPAAASVDAASLLATARTLIGKGFCEEANYSIKQVLDAQPDNAEARELQAKPCTPVPVTTPKSTRPPQTTQGPTVIPHSEGGLDPKTGETAQGYADRVKAVRARYDTLLQQLSRGVSRGAVNQLESFSREFGQDYLDVRAQLSEARRLLRNLAQTQLQEARAFEESKEWDRALDRLTRAGENDAELTGVEAERARIETKKRDEWQQACREAKQQISYPQFRAAAIEKYKRVRALAPNTDPCYADAVRYTERQD